MPVDQYAAAAGARIAQGCPTGGPSRMREWPTPCCPSRRTLPAVTDPGSDRRHTGTSSMHCHDGYPQAIDVHSVANVQGSIKQSIDFNLFSLNLSEMSASSCPYCIDRGNSGQSCMS
jgi:hypothetical protein